jgi:uncharacterized SAM-binding protein YcdF (DUF218 family)
MAAPVNASPSRWNVFSDERRHERAASCMRALINPLLWLLVLQAACCWTLWRYRAARTLIAASVLLLWATSTPFFQHALESSLQLDDARANMPGPSHVFVLAGGWRPGPTPELDILQEETQRRVLHAVAVWRRFPAARLVISGSSGDERAVGNRARQGELMADLASSRGVPFDALVLETRSGNTFEHALEAARLPGVDRDSHIGIVTTGWHMRRAKQQFCRHFERLSVYPVPVEERRFAVADLVPNPGALTGSSVLVQEWIGVAWYALRNRIGPGAATSRCRDAPGPDDAERLHSRWHR